MNIKSEIIKYFIDKINTNIDLSDILDEDGKQFFTSQEPFRAIEFKEIDNGTFRAQAVTNIIREQEHEGFYIPVGFKGASLSKENILAIGDNPIESWSNIVTLEFFISIEDVEIYTKVFEKLQVFYDAFLFNNIELITFQGKQRQIDLTSTGIIDVEGSIKLTNSNDYKITRINVATGVTNKGIVKGSRKQYEIDGNLAPVIAKGYSFDKVMVDNSTAELDTSKFIPDIATSNISVNVALDFDNPLIVKVFDEIKNKDIIKTYQIKTIYNLPDKTSKTLGPDTYFLESYLETSTEQGAIIVTLKYREA